MWQAPKTRECCGTCANWDGTRRKSMGGGIEADLGCKGKCYCGHNTSTQGNGPSAIPCKVNNKSDWQMWPALR